MYRNVKQSLLLFVWKYKEALGLYIFAFYFHDLMESKALKQKLGSLEIQEKRMLKTFQSDIKALQMNHEEHIFEKLCRRRKHNAESQENL